MRLVVLVLAALSLGAPAYAQNSGSFEPYSAYVAPAGGLRVREEPHANAPVLATLWQGARVFVREPGAQYVRVDGYGVAGYAFVDGRYLTDEPPTGEPPSLATANEQSSAPSRSR